ncbi:MAG: hypothetical protein IPJ41_15320 [Phycisphaerales bacterium]|nr:hypothetical protein [Phycisphaerales bacterium]
MVIGCAGTPGTGGQAAGGTGGGMEGPLLSREGLPYGPVRAHVCPKCGPGVAAVAFNGCIYNHRELRRELEAAGHEFFTDHSDTEVLLHGWREWAGGLWDRLEGMFVVAIWDASSGSLLSARDRMGEKPLYGTDRIGPPLTQAFASTASAIAKLPLGPEPRLEKRSVAALQSLMTKKWLRCGYPIFPDPRRGSAPFVREGSSG